MRSLLIVYVSLATTKIWIEINHRNTFHIPKISGYRGSIRFNGSEFKWKSEYLGILPREFTCGQNYTLNLFRFI